MSACARSASFAFSSLLALLIAPPLASAQTLFSVAGVNGPTIQGAVDAFRASLGGANNGVGGTFPTGRRELNWDGLADAFAAPGYHVLRTRAPRARPSPHVATVPNELPTTSVDIP